MYERIKVRSNVKKDFIGVSIISSRSVDFLPRVPVNFGGRQNFRKCRKSRFRKISGTFCKTPEYISLNAHTLCITVSWTHTPPGFIYREEKRNNILFWLQWYNFLCCNGAFLDSFDIDKKQRSILPLATKRS